MLVAQAIEFVQAIVDPLWLLDEVEIVLLRAAQPLAGGERFRAAATDDLILLAAHLVR